MKAPDLKSSTHLKEDLVALRQDVRALRDELVLKAHLARMDAKKNWEELQPQIDRALTDVGSEAAKLARDVKDRLVALKEQLTKN